MLAASKEKRRRFSFLARRRRHSRCRGELTSWSQIAEAADDERIKRDYPVIAQPLGLAASPLYLKIGSC
jgi:hypothetical protein